jgi:hypothetical protein
VAGPYSIFYDPTQNPGERLAPEIRTEIAEVAPSVVIDGSITTAKLQDASVSTPKIIDLSVTEPKFAAGAVSARALATNAVQTPNIQGGAVTPAKCGAGVVTSVDNTGATVATTEWYGTSAQWAAIATKDPNTTYFITP